MYYSENEPPPHLKNEKSQKKQDKFKILFLNTFSNIKSGQVNVEDLPITEEVLRKPTYSNRLEIRRVLTEEIKTKLRGFIKKNKWKQKHYMSK